MNYFFTPPFSLRYSLENDAFLDMEFIIVFWVCIIVFSIFFTWLGCYLVKKGILKDSPFLIIFGVILGSFWIPLIYYFLIKDKYTKLVKTNKITVFLTWLKTGKRLADIKTYKIPDESIKDDFGDDVSLGNLAFITSETSYENLSNEEKGFLLKISSISYSKGKIDDLINKSKNKEKETENEK